MKKRIWMYTLCICIAVVYGCKPAEIEESLADGPNVEEPDVPVPPPVPDDPEKPVVPDEDEGSSGKPGKDEADEYSEESKEIYVRDFLNTKPDLSDYRMIDADGLDADKNSILVQTWHQEQNGLASSMFDEAAHDHWLITEGIYINYPKVVIAWTMFAETFDEEYEVYVSNSPDKESFTKLIYSEKLKQGKPIGRTVDRVVEGYQGQTLYIAFRHNTSTKQKMTLTLEKLSVFSLQHDDVDLVTDQMWLTHPKYVASSQNISTGTTYIPGIDLKVTMVIKNLGQGLRGEDVTVSYQYGDKTVTEVIPNLYLLHRETYVHKFRTLLVTEKTVEEQPVIVSVAPLPDEKLVKSNNRYLTIDYLSGDPHYRILFEKLSKLDCYPCGLVLHEFDKIDEAFPESTIGITTMYDNGLKPARNAGEYWGMIGNISQSWGTPTGCYDRIGKAYPRMNNVTTLMSNGTFAKRMFPPFAIDVTHEFSADGTMMYVRLKVTCLADLENEDYSLTAVVLEDNIKEYPNQTGVPKAVHDHILRDFLVDDFRTGLKGIIPANVKAGEEFEHTFEYPVPATFGKHTTDLTQLYAVGSIIDCLDNKRIVNSNKSIKTASLSKKRRR